MTLNAHDVLIESAMALPGTEISWEQEERDKDMKDHILASKKSHDV